MKQLVCDRRVGHVPLAHNLKLVCACNPYKRHTDAVIKKLERAGLGYRVNEDETTDRFGLVPMRQLVYRVQPLPLSLIPYCWDFGQLSSEVELLYIRQMVTHALARWRDDNLLQFLAPEPPPHLLSHMFLNK